MRSRAMKTPDRIPMKPDVETINWRPWLIFAIALGCVVGVMLLRPVARDLNYHFFADQETWLGVSNFWNVVSNLPFVAAGLFGFWRRPLAVSARLVPGYVSPGWSWSRPTAASRPSRSGIIRMFRHSCS